MGNEKFWMVWNPLRDAPRHRHGSRSLAQSEAVRLARQHPDDHFYVLEAVSLSRFNSVDTRELKAAQPACEQPPWAKPETLPF